MLKTKKFLVALAIALMISAGSVAPAQAGHDKSTSTQGGGWCC